jgi:pimeloyl-ACP methyl ester carboxylesterase
VVLVIPAALMPDAMTASLRRFLGRCGYRAFGWNAGPNVGPTPRILAALHRRVAELYALESGPISVVGISLGGLLARNLAHDAPESVRQVITMASPVRFPTASTIEPLFRVCAAVFRPKIDLDRLSRPPSVPSTSIYTRDDGLVAWESCQTDNDIEVGGPHIMICRNPKALRALAERLDPARR